jgi:hypothetical protein
MTPDAYSALIECAHRRFAEWHLTPRERRVLDLVLQLSFAKHQMWAATPKLSLLATALQMDKAGASRTINALMAKGALKQQRHLGEYLFQIALMCPTVPLAKQQRKTAKISAAEAKAALDHLMRINTVRDNGRADAHIDPVNHIQPRLEMLLGEAHQDAEGAAMAFAAMMEKPQVFQWVNAVGEPPRAGRSCAGPEGSGKCDPSAACREPKERERPWTARAEDVTAGETALESYGNSTNHRNAPDDPCHSARDRTQNAADGTAQKDSQQLRGNAAATDAVEDKLKQFRSGLEPTHAEIWDQLLDQARQGGSEVKPKQLLRELVQYGAVWRWRVQNYPWELREAVSDHRLLMKRSRHPLAWIHNMFKRRGGLDPREYAKKAGEELDKMLGT